MSEAIISPFDERVNITGRYLRTQNNSLLIGYPGVQVDFSVTAKNANVYLKSSEGQSYIDILVDGHKTHTYKVAANLKSYPIFTDNIDLPQQHRISIVHRTETWQGLLDISHIEIHDGTISIPHPLPSKKLLFIGDSVTCGEGVDRPTNAQAVNKSNAWWNGGESYGKLLGKALNAQVHLVCFGGRGLIRSWDGSTTDLNAPDFFELAIPETQSKLETLNNNWPHSEYVPNLIFISLGTNDFSASAGALPDESLYVSQYVSFLNRIRNLYPNAEIVLTEGAILNDADRKTKSLLQDYIRKTIAQLNDRKLHFIASRHYPGDAIDGHPTGAQHQKMAKDFLPELKKLLQ